jgi:DNA repair and recombination protein RAD54B
VHPNTACHTHELLECPCDATGVHTHAPTSTTDDKDASGANSEDEFDEEERELVRTFQAASQLRPEDLDRVDKAVSCTYLLPGRLADLV